MAYSGTSYGSSYSQAHSSYSSGIWQGANAVFPPLPTQPPPPGTATSASFASAPPSSQPKRPASYNFKLRRSIQPRPPLTILNELAGTNKVQFDYLDVPDVERQRRAWQMDVDVDQVGIYECRCTVQDLEFIAEGTNKLEAKMAVSELAIQGLISKKCELNDWEGVGSAEDNCPWSTLASLALYRLYNDWQSQGYSLPKELTNLPGDIPGVKGGRRVGGGQENTSSVTDLDKPALQLINEMAAKTKLSVEFELTGEVGTPNDKVFTMSMKIGEKIYSGQAKTKKGAKQVAAAMALEDKDAWYVPPPPPPAEPEWDEYEEEWEEEQAQEGPPSKKKAGEGEKDLASEEQLDTEQDNTDRGKQPGSYPAKK